MVRGRQFECAHWTSSSTRCTRLIQLQSRHLMWGPHLHARNPTPGTEQSTGSGLPAAEIKFGHAIGHADCQSRASTFLLLLETRSPTNSCGSFVRSCLSIVDFLIFGKRALSGWDGRDVVEINAPSCESHHVTLRGKKMGEGTEVLPAVGVHTYGLVFPIYRMLTLQSSFCIPSLVVRTLYNGREKRFRWRSVGCIFNSR